MASDYVTTDELTAEVKQLREENARLRAEIERLGPKPGKSTGTSK
jgi:cell division protein FtsB